MKGYTEKLGLRPDFAKFIHCAQKHAYGEMASLTDELTKKVGVSLVPVFLNLQDAAGKTLIHHIIENPENGSRAGIWAIIELCCKGADLNIADNLGDTALHTCANLYAKLMSNSESDISTLFTMGTREGLIEVKRGGRRPVNERIMLAFMADVGAMVLCGAKPKLTNLAGEEVLQRMANIATLMDYDYASAKPNISEASCTKAFMMFFESNKPQFLNNGTYSWATNVVSWVTRLRLDASVKNVSLVVKRDEETHDCDSTTTKTVDGHNGGEESDFPAHAPTTTHGFF